MTLIAFILTNWISGQLTLNSIASGNWNNATIWRTANSALVISTTPVPSNNVTGIGTSFLTDLHPGDVIINNGVTVIGTILSITDNTHLKLTANAAIANYNGVYKIRRVPTTSDNVSINNPNNVILNIASATILNLTTNAGGTLFINANILNLSGGYDGNGAITFTTGTLNVEQDITNTGALT